MELTELETFNEFAKILLEQITKRQKDLFNNMAFCAAIFMDPRFNFRGSSYLSQEKKNLAKVIIYIIYICIIKFNYFIQLGTFI